jgi:hypothetical protein
VTFPRRFHRLRLRSLAVALAALILALTAATATARPAEQFLEPAGSCEQQWIAAYGAEALGSCEQQALASRGTGSPTASTVTLSDVPRVEAPDSGFHWGSAAIGAAAVAGLFAVGTLGAMALDRRGRVRTAG